mgnify:CR=1 FL=1
MGKVLAFINQKGGVGKTTSAVNVGLSLAVSEIKTLIVDLDPQANATIGLSDLTEKSEKNIYDTDLKKPLAIVMGSENKGINKSVLKISDEIVKLPMYGKIESLNVSVACGAFLSEVMRQRNK